MEIFGIPVVVTVNDILGMAGVAICMVAIAGLLAACFVIEV